MSEIVIQVVEMEVFVVLRRLFCEIWFLFVLNPIFSPIVSIFAQTLNFNAFLNIFFVIRSQSLSH